MEELAFGKPEQEPLHEGRAYQHGDSGTDPLGAERLFERRRYEPSWPTGYTKEQKQKALRENENDRRQTQRERERERERRGKGGPGSHNLPPL